MPYILHLLKSCTVVGMYTVTSHSTATEEETEMIIGKSSLKCQKNILKCHTFCNC